MHDLPSIIKNPAPGNVLAGRSDSFLPYKNYDKTWKRAEDDNRLKALRELVL